MLIPWAIGLTWWGAKSKAGGELFNEEFRGKTSILDIPQIGIMDAAMVAEALGLMTFGDKGNMTRAEIDQITENPQRAKGQRSVPCLLEDL